MSADYQHGDKVELTFVATVENGIYWVGDSSIGAVGAVDEYAESHSLRERTLPQVKDLHAGTLFFDDAGWLYRKGHDGPECIADEGPYFGVDSHVGLDEPIHVIPEHLVDSIRDLLSDIKREVMP